MSEGRLYVCATPIGNLGDVSDRLREVLGSVDMVYAEDTRRAAKLLSHLGVEKQVRSMFTGNEKARSREIIENLVSGLDVAVVTDAGTTAVSDPGAWVVSLAHEQDVPVTVIPGPSAVTAALAVSGFPADRFAFEGFLPRKGRERDERLSRITADDRTTVLFASPRRLAEDLADLSAALGRGRRVVVARELTKLFEEIWIGSLGDAVVHWADGAKGEVTLVVAPGGPQQLDFDSALAMAKGLVASGASVSEAARTASEATGVSRRQIYEALL